MSDSNKKELRKQLRNVVQAELPEVIKSELYMDLHKQLTEALNKRLDSIEEFCQKSLKAQDDRAKAVQGFIVREVKVEILNRLHNMDVTMRAWQEVMASKLGDIQELNAQIDAKKVEINSQLEKEALEAQQKAISGKSSEEQTA